MGQNTIINHPKVHYSRVPLAVLGDPLDPSEVVSNLGVDTRVVSVGAADAPRYDALKFTVTNEWSSGVTLRIDEKSQRV